LRKGERCSKKAFVTIFPARKGFFATNREKTRRIFLPFAKEVYGADFQGRPSRRTPLRRARDVFTTPEDARRAFAS